MFYDLWRIRRAEKLEWLGALGCIAAVHAVPEPWNKENGTAYVLLAVGILPTAISILNYIRFALRIQVLPIYFVDILLLSKTIPTYLNQHVPAGVSGFFLFLHALCLLISAILLYVLPPFTFPWRFRQASTGVQHLFWTAPADNRAHAATMWYPTTKSFGTKGTLLGYAGKSIIFHFFDLLSGSRLPFKVPLILLYHLITLPTNSIKNAPMKPADNSEASDDDESLVEGAESTTGRPAKRKLIVFSHGLFSFPTMHTFLAEQLAARGYVVIVLLHTDGSAGHCVGHDGAVMHEFLDCGYNDDEPTQQARYGQIERRVHDIEAAIEWAKSSEYSDIIDTDHVTAAGHSFGGGSVVFASQRIDCVKGVVSLDGWLEPLRGTVDSKNKWKKTHPTRVLFVNSELWQWPENRRLMEAVRTANPAKVSMITLKGTSHHHYDEVAQWLCRPLAKMIINLGPADREKATLACVDAIQAMVEARTDEGFTNAVAEVDAKWHKGTPREPDESSRL